MSTFEVKYRKTSPLLVENVTASTREEAIQHVVDGVAEGEQIEVFDVPELLDGPVGVPGTTGATGTTGVTGATGGARASRAQLNEMTKEELLAMADREGVEANQSWNKADIIDAIVKHK